MLTEELPQDVAEMVEWIAAAVMLLREQNGWSINLNGNAGTVQADVRKVEHTTTASGDKRRTEVRDTREFRLRAQIK